MPAETWAYMLGCQDNHTHPLWPNFHLSVNSWLEVSHHVCEALNVTVSPGPRVQYAVGENASLFCHVSQKRRPESLLAVRWVFALPPAQEYLMIKMTKYGVVQYYGNYTRHFYKQRLLLLEERHRTVYKFLILNLQQTDQGHYICKVQEIGKHRNKWTAWSNGSASTEIQVISSEVLDDSSSEKNRKAWKFFEDMYVYAVFVCSIGIVSVLLFTLVILCQTLINKKRPRDSTAEFVLASKQADLAIRPLRGKDKMSTCHLEI
ncbi:UNVERIFIED_CONTAM: V-set and transmembrane domain-containing protein 4 [Gekko kuhli]